MFYFYMKSLNTLISPKHLIRCFGKFADMMGVNTTIKVHDHWCEPAIIWTILCARRGTGKTAILKQLIRPILKLQCEHERQWHLTRPSANQGGASGNLSPSKLLAGPTSITELYHILEKNGGQTLTLEENLEGLHKRLLTDTDRTVLEAEELHNLYDAMPKFSSKDGEVSIMTTTCYNHAAMTTPQYLMELFYNPRLLLYDRYLIACPSDLAGQSKPPDSIPLLPSPSPPTIKAIFQTLYMFHRQSREYVFSPEALMELNHFKEKELASIKSQFDNANAALCAIDKSLGQTVRIAGVLKALTTACVFATQATGLQFLKWDLTVDKEAVLMAIRIQKYFLEQKLILLHNVAMLVDASSPCLPSTSFQVQSTSQSPLAESPMTSFPDIRSPTLSECHETFVPDFMSMSPPQFVVNFTNKIRRLLEYADDGNGIPASVAAQYSIPPIVHIPGSSNRKPSWVAELFFKKVADLGIGRLCYIKHHANRKYYLRFRRKRPEELTEADRKLLASIRVNMDLYCRIGGDSLPSEVVLSHADEELSPFLSTIPFTEAASTSYAEQAVYPDRYIHTQGQQGALGVKRERGSDAEEDNPHSSGT